MAPIIEQIRKVFVMPWLLSNEIRRFIFHPIIRIGLRLSGVSVGGNCKFYGKPIIQRCKGSNIELSNGVILRSHRLSNPLTPNHPVVLSTRSTDATISIKTKSGLTGTTVVAESGVTIGERTAVGSNTYIVDTDFHPIDPDKRKTDFLSGDTEPIEIGSDVFIGMDSIILKGVQVGDGAVIGAGSVVTSDVPEGSLVAGNPATVQYYTE